MTGIAVHAAGDKITNWTSIRVHRSLSDATATVMFVCPADPAIQPPVSLNSKIEITHDSDLVAVAWAETATSRTAKATADLTYGGRGPLADLIDVSARPWQLGEGATLDDLAQLLADRLALHYLTSAAAQRHALPPLQWRPGEACAALLSRAAAGSGAVIMETAAGELHLFAAATAAPSATTIDPAAAISWTQRIDVSQVFATHTVLGPGADETTDAIEGEAASTIPTRPAREIIHVSKADLATPAQAGQVADAHRRRADSRYFAIEVEIVGWTVAGRLPRLGDGIRAGGHDTIVSAITHSADAATGSKTVLTLTLPGAWTPTPVWDTEAQAIY